MQKIGEAMTKAESQQPQGGEQTQTENKKENVREAEFKEKKNEDKKDGSNLNDK